MKKVHVISLAIGVGAVVTGIGYKVAKKLKDRKLKDSLDEDLDAFFDDDLDEIDNKADDSNSAKVDAITAEDKENSTVCTDSISKKIKSKLFK